MKRTSPAGRSKTPSFVALQHRILQHPNFIALSAKAVKLLIDACAQFRGSNNGDLCLTWSLMQQRGWRSRETLSEALDELQHYGFLTLTRQGGKHKPSLYALTWAPINECKRKLDVPATTKAGNEWQENRPAFAPKRNRKLKSLARLSCQCDTPIVSKGDETCAQTH